MFFGLGPKLNLRNITCPVYLLAGAADSGSRLEMKYIDQQDHDDYQQTAGDP
jgi:hypothetical protein